MRNWSANVRQQRAEIARIAADQWGRIRWDQLISAGARKNQISRWVVEGYLHPIYPRVYAVGHTHGSIEADLVAAVFYAGPGAMLSHETAAWWWELTDRIPTRIHVTTPKRCASLNRRGPRRGIQVHSRRPLERVWHRRLPVTNVTQTLVDFASVASFGRVRYALAEADYQRLLDYDAVERLLGRGRPGSDMLRRALGKHRPELAYTRSEFERRFIELCEWGSLPIPKFNVKVLGMTVDALWRKERVIIELDGKRGHGTAAQVARDHERDLRLRAAGFTVLRYTWGQITSRRELILADLRRALGLHHRFPGQARPLQAPPRRRA
jgi:very-short-patch-repair endonuclease